MVTQILAAVLVPLATVLTILGITWLAAHL
jgi:hypothetical protein